MASAADMTTGASTLDPYDLAIVRTLQAMLEDAVRRSDQAEAHALAEQIQDEVRRQDARGGRR